MHNKALNALFQNVGQFSQEENAAITYTVNWAAFLDTDTISSSTWTTEDSGGTIANALTPTTQTTSARLSGNIGRFRFINQIVTAAGDTYERAVDLTVRDNSTGYNWDYWDYGRGYL